CGSIPGAAAGPGGRASGRPPLHHPLSSPGRRCGRLWTLVPPRAASGNRHLRASQRRRALDLGTPLPSPNAGAPRPHRFSSPGAPRRSRPLLAGTARAAGPPEMTEATQSADVSAAFRAEYAAHRATEGCGYDRETLLALPYLDRGPFADQWDL